MVGSRHIFSPSSFTHVAASFVGVPFAVLIVDSWPVAFCVRGSLDRRVPATVALLGRRTQVHHRANAQGAPSLEAGRSGDRFLNKRGRKPTRSYTRIWQPIVGSWYK